MSNLIRPTRQKPVLNNPKWKEIAQAGNDFALKNFNNDAGVSSLVDLMAELI